MFSRVYLPLTLKITGAAGFILSIIGGIIQWNAESESYHESLWGIERQPFGFADFMGYVMAGFLICLGFFFMAALLEYLEEIEWHLSQEGKE